MQIFITSDHSGIDKRHHLIDFITNLGYQVTDLGTEDTTSNYAELAIKLGTGIGISIACNKVKGIRCALVDKVENAHLVKEHNNANVISLGARTTSLEEMETIIKIFLDAEFEGGRHQARIDTISEYEAK